MVNPNSTDTTDPLHIFERLKLQHSMRLVTTNLYPLQCFYESHTTL